MIKDFKNFINEAQYATDMGFKDYIELKKYIKFYDGEYRIVKKKKKGDITYGFFYTKDKNQSKIIDYDWESFHYATIFTKDEANKIIEQFEKNPDYYYQKSIKRPNGRIDIESWME